MSSVFGGTEGGVCERQVTSPSSREALCGFSACENEGGFCGRLNNKL